MWRTTSALLLCALTVRADYYRWGTISRNNYVYTYSGNWEAVSDDNAHAYLYLGTAQITEEGGKKVVHLDDLTYITDGGISDSRFGNYSAVKAADFQANDNVLSVGGQAHTIILVGKKNSGESLSGAIEDNYQARSVTLFTSTSIGAMSTDTTPVPYADCATDHSFKVKSDCIEYVKFVRNAEPVGKGGYVTGYANGNAGSIPTAQASAYIADSNARMYVYKGTAAIDDRGVIDFSRLSYITNFIPAYQGHFGNYKSDGVAKANLYENDLISPEGGENFAIFVVSTDGNPAAMPARFYDFQANNYVAIYNVTSVKRVTSDNWQYAQLTIDSQIVPADYNKGRAQTATPLVPIVFHDHIEYSDSLLTTLKIPKTYVMGYLGADKTDEQLRDGSLVKWDNGPYSLMEAYVLGKDPNTKTDIPTVLLVQTASANTLQLNVSNATVNEKANAKVKYGLISSLSPDFTNPTVEFEPRASPLLEGALPASGVKYYRAILTIQGK